MSRESVLALGRAAAEAGMADTCTITRASDPVTDPDTGAVTETTTTVYTGMCRVQQPPAIARPDTVGAALVFQQPFQLQLPMDGTEDVHVGDRVVITASEFDADLVDRAFWVRALAHKTHSTSRRLGLEQVTS